MGNAKKCAEFIKESNFIVAMSGAGISTNAGIPDFRGPNGIYVSKKYDPYETFGLKYFLQNPVSFYDFAREFVSIIEKVKPTFTHYFLAKLEKSGKLKSIITQNIDGLHQKAGSDNIIELHGSFEKSICLQCGKEYSFEEMKKKVFKEKIPHCDICGGLIKPDIVFFGEQVKNFENVEEIIYQSDLLLIIGSSLTVYPASMLADFARGHIIVVSNGKVNIDSSRADIFAREDIDEFFKNVSKYFKEAKEYE